MLTYAYRIEGLPVSNACKLLMKELATYGMQNPFLVSIKACSCGADQISWFVHESY
jgi:hypothetical protein